MTALEHLRYREKMFKREHKLLVRLFHLLRSQIKVFNLGGDRLNHLLDTWITWTPPCSPTLTQSMTTGVCSSVSPQVTRPAAITSEKHMIYSGGGPQDVTAALSVCY